MKGRCNSRTLQAFHGLQTNTKKQRPRHGRATFALSVTLLCGNLEGNDSTQRHSPVSLADDYGYDFTFMISDDFLLLVLKIMMISYDHGHIILPLVMFSSLAARFYRLPQKKRKSQFRHVFPEFAHCEKSLLRILWTVSSKAAIVPSMAVCEYGKEIIGLPSSSPV